MKPKWTQIPNVENTLPQTNSPEIILNEYNKYLYQKLMENVPNPLIGLVSSQPKVTEMRLGKNDKISTVVNPIDERDTPMIDEKGNKNSDRPALSIPNTLQV